MKFYAAKLRNFLFYNKLNYDDDNSHSRAKHCKQRGAFYPNDKANEEMLYAKKKRKMTGREDDDNHKRKEVNVISTRRFSHQKKSLSAVM